MNCSMIINTGGRNITVEVACWKNKWKIQTKRGSPSTTIKCISWNFILQFVGYGPKKRKGSTSSGPLEKIFMNETCHQLRSLIVNIFY